MAAFFFVLGSFLAAQAQSQSPFYCYDGLTYQFQGGSGGTSNGTYCNALDFASGTITRQGTNNGSNGIIFGNITLNAFGYNPVDNYLWGQVNNSNPTQLVRVGTEFVGRGFTYAFPNGYNETAFVVGDIDKNGIMYMTRGGSSVGLNRTTTEIYIIDLKQVPATPNPATPASPLTVTVLSTPVSTYLTDWAVSPKDTCLYALYTYFSGTNTAKTTLYRFATHDRTFNGQRITAGTRQTLGTATGGSTPIAPANFGAAFMDNNGSFYVVANVSGYTHRIDNPDKLPAVTDETTPVPVTYIGTAPNATDGNTDGARCALSRPTSGSATPLPVSLVSFVATAAPNRGVQLAWNTASELNNDFFEVQRSLDGNTFTAIGKVAGNGSTAQPATYSFTDAAPGNAATYYYRLRQVNFDGTSTFSTVRAITLAAGTSALVLTAAPNPTTPANLRVQVQYGGSAAAPAVLTLHNLLGQALFTQAVTLQPGANVLAPGSSAAVAPGVYWLTVGGDATLGKQGVKVLLTQ